MQFQVYNEIFELLPDACFGVVAVKGAGNDKEITTISNLLLENIAVCEGKLSGVKVKEMEEIICYREAFRTLGINPNKFMCSIEALLSRIAKGKGFPHINPLVDLGNAISLKYQLPIGAHDIDTISHSLDVRYAVEGDTFIPFGGGDVEIPDAKEVIYVSDHEVRTRRWTWRQSEIGKITENTGSVLFPIDGFTSINKDKVLQAREELAQKLQDNFQCQVITGFIDKNETTFQADFK